MPPKKGIDGVKAAFMRHFADIAVDSPAMYNLAFRNYNLTPGGRRGGFFVEWASLYEIKNPPMTSGKSKRSIVDMKYVTLDNLDPTSDEKVAIAIKAYDPLTQMVFILCCLRPYYLEAMIVEKDMHRMMGVDKTDIRPIKAVLVLEKKTDAPITDGYEITCGAAGCVKTKKLQICAQCKTLKYCSRECQRAHWKVHKAVCEQYKKEISPDVD